MEQLVEWWWLWRFVVLAGWSGGCAVVVVEDAVVLEERVGTVGGETGSLGSTGAAAVVAALYSAGSLVSPPAGEYFTH